MLFRYDFGIRNSFFLLLLKTIKIDEIFKLINFYVNLIFFAVVFSFIKLIICNKVISPELIREVEARMNRNYLPPSLKHANQGAVGSPPTSNSYILSSQQRRFGRACKLPTVQENMGKFISKFKSKTNVPGGGEQLYCY